MIGILIGLVLIILIQVLMPFSCYYFCKTLKLILRLSFIIFKTMVYQQEIAFGCE